MISYGLPHLDSKSNLPLGVGRNYESFDLVPIYEGRGKSKLKSTPMEMYEALNGKIRGHHVILLGMHNSNIVFLEKQINELEIN